MPRWSPYRVYLRYVRPILKDQEIGRDGALHWEDSNANRHPGKPFSKRYGYKSQPREITVWEDAPLHPRVCAISFWIRQSRWALVHTLVETLFARCFTRALAEEIAYQIFKGSGVLIARPDRRSTWLELDWAIGRIGHLSGGIESSLPQKKQTAFTVIIEFREADSV